MFRFSVRDLLWLTLVVAVALGWFAHQRQLREEGLAREQHFQAEAEKWEMAFRAVAQAFKHEGWDVNVDFAASFVSADNHKRAITLQQGLGSDGRFGVSLHPLKKPQ
jgi:hypothetical protein